MNGLEKRVLLLERLSGNYSIHLDSLYCFLLLTFDRTFFGLFQNLSHVLFTELHGILSVQNSVNNGAAFFYHYCIISSVTLEMLVVLYFLIKRELTFIKFNRGHFCVKFFLAQLTNSYGQIGCQLWCRLLAGKNLTQKPEPSFPASKWSDGWFATPFPVTFHACGFDRNGKWEWFCESKLCCKNDVAQMTLQKWRRRP